MNRRAYFGRDVAATIFLVVLLAFCGLALGAYLPHFHSAFEDTDQCPLHVFAKQAQSVPSVAVTLVVFLALAPVCIGRCISRFEREYFPCGLTRGPPLVS
jgi:hypothetical protein